MLTIQYLTPCSVKMKQNRLHLEFSYPYCSIIKDEEAYHFIPLEGKEIIVNTKTKQVENLATVFVFQRGERFIRLPLYQLLLVSNAGDHLRPLIERYVKDTPSHETKQPEQEQKQMGCSEEVVHLIDLLEKQNVDRLIDQALTEKNEDLFYKLLEQRTSY